VRVGGVGSGVERERREFVRARNMEMALGRIQARIPQWDCSWSVPVVGPLFVAAEGAVWGLEKDLMLFQAASPLRGYP
jgi:hypothetical protein